MWPTRTQLLLEKLEIEFPIIQAPMAGVTTPALVADATKGGGLGSLPAGYSSPDEFLKLIIETQKRLPNASRFSANVFIPDTAIHKSLHEKRKRMNELLNTYRNKLNIPSNPIIPEQPSLDDILDIILDQNIPIVSFTFGIPTQKQIQRLKKQKIILIGTATTVKEALAIEASGCDMVIAQGLEAGGHRGTFLEPIEKSLINTMTLVSQITSALQIPVIAAGGIMNGNGIAEAIKIQSSAVQMGTAFLRCPESSAPDVYKEAIANSNDESTVITTAITGKAARGIRNELIIDLEKHLEDILPYPEQHYMTAPIRKAAAQQNLSQYMSLWAGQRSRLSQALPADILMRQFANEALLLLSHSL